MKDPVVYLDLTHLDEAHVKARFPRIHATCLQFNIDIVTDLIPIRPAAHYSMGGVRTDLDARTSLAGLMQREKWLQLEFTAQTVLPVTPCWKDLYLALAPARRCAMNYAKALRETNSYTSSLFQWPVDAAIGRNRREIQDLMWQDVGIVRTGQGMKHAMNA